MFRIQTLLLGAAILQVSLAAVLPAQDDTAVVVDNIAEATDLSPRDSKGLRQRSAETTFTNDHQFVYTGSDAGHMFQYPTPPPSTQKPQPKPTSEYGLKPNEDGVSLQFDFVHKPAFFKRRDDRPSQKFPEAAKQMTSNKQVVVPKQHHHDHRYVNPYVAAYGQLPSMVRNMWKDWKARLSTVRRNGNNNLNLHPTSALLSAFPARLGGKKISKSGQPLAAAATAPAVQNRIVPIGYKVAFQPSLE